MGFAIFHASKGKGSGANLGNHIDRVEGKENTYKHADKSRTKNNINFELHEGRHAMPLSQAISERIKEGYKGKRKIRSDAVKHLSHVYTGSHDEMQKIFSTNDFSNQWIEKNLAFVRKEFGAENIVRASLHLDEKTPHLHVVTVPLTQDGRLSAKEIMGNKKDLQKRQDRYAEQMKEFGLYRGIRNTGIKHENAKDYYSRIKEARHMSEKSIEEPVKGVFGIDKSKTIEKQKEALKTLYLALKEKEQKEQKNKFVVKRAFNLESAQKKEIVDLKAKNENIKSSLEKQFKDIVQDPEKLQSFKRQVQQEKINFLKSPKIKRNRGLYRDDENEIER